MVHCDALTHGCQRRHLGWRPLATATPKTALRGRQSAIGSCLEDQGVVAPRIGNGQDKKSKFDPFRLIVLLMADGRFFISYCGCFLFIFLYTLRCLCSCFMFLSLHNALIRALWHMRLHTLHRPTYMNHN